MKRSISTALLSGATLVFTLGGCAMDLDLADSESSAEADFDVASQQHELSGWVLSSPDLDSIARITIAGDSRPHTGVYVSPNLVLTHKRWADWSTSTSSVTVNYPGTGLVKATRHVNSNAYFPAALIDTVATSAHTYPIDQRTASQLNNVTLTCYGYTSSTTLRYAYGNASSSSGSTTHVTLAANSAFGMRFHDWDAGIPCFDLNNWNLVGFVDSVNSQGVAQVYLVRHIGEWISGMEHLTAARERNATRVSIYTKPNSTQRMCLDVPWGSPYQHTPVNQYPCHYGPAQVFYLDWKGSSDATLIAASSGKCIDVPSGTSNSGQNLQIYTCHDGPNQRWDFDFHSSGSGWRIYPLSASSRCLSVEGGASTQSRVTEQRTCIGSSDQRWYWQF